jgi:hypothetical protein
MSFDFDAAVQAALDHPDAAGPSRAMADAREGGLAWLAANAA